MVNFLLCLPALLIAANTQPWTQLFPRAVCCDKKSLNSSICHTNLYMSAAEYQYEIDNNIQKKFTTWGEKKEKQKPGCDEVIMLVMQTVE